MVLGLKHSWRFSWEIYRSGHFCLSSDRVTDGQRLVYCETLQFVWWFFSKAESPSVQCRLSIGYLSGYNHLGALQEIQMLDPIALE